MVDLNPKRFWTVSPCSATVSRHPVHVLVKYGRLVSLAVSSVGVMDEISMNISRGHEPEPNMHRHADSMPLTPLSRDRLSE